MVTEGVGNGAEADSLEHLEGLGDVLVYVIVYNLVDEGAEREVPEEWEGDRI
jgi:nitrate reductase NapAB chaperone NapD